MNSVNPQNSAVPGADNDPEKDSSADTGDSAEKKPDPTGGNSVNPETAQGESDSSSVVSSQSNDNSQHNDDHSAEVVKVQSRVPVKIQIPDRALSKAKSSKLLVKARSLVRQLLMPTITPRPTQPQPG